MGSHFIKYLLDGNLATQVTVLDNLSYAADQSRLSGYESHFSFKNCDLRDPGQLIEATVGADIVFNFAAETHNDNSLKRPFDFIQTNVMGTYNLLEAARQNGFHLHQVSTDEVYGDLPLGSSAKFTEASAANASSPYSASKAAGDQLVKSWVRSFGVSATITNSANNFGPGQHPEKLIPRTLALIKAGRKPQLYGTGSNVRDWLYVEDHSAAVWLVATQGKIGQNYIVSAQDLLSNLDLIRLINAAHGLPHDFIEFVPDRPGHDLQYSSDSSRLRNELFWRPSGVKVETWLGSLSVA